MTCYVYARLAPSQMEYEILQLSRYIALLDWLGYKDRESTLSFVLIILVGRVSLNRDFPESFLLNGIYNFSNLHFVNCCFVSNFDSRICFQVVVPKWMFWSATLSCYEDVVFSIHNSHEWGLANCAGLPATIRDNDDWQTRVLESQALVVLNFKMSHSMRNYGDETNDKDHPCL